MTPEPNQTTPEPNDTSVEENHTFVDHRPFMLVGGPIHGDIRIVGRCLEHEHWPMLILDPVGNYYEDSGVYRWHEHTEACDERS